MRETRNLEVDFVRAPSECCATRAADAGYCSRRASFENRKLTEGGSERGLARLPKLLSCSAAQFHVVLRAGLLSLSPGRC